MVLWSLNLQETGAVRVYWLEVEPTAGSVAEGAGASAGTATAAAVGATIAAAAGTAAGTSTVAGASGSGTIASGAGTSAGAATADAVGVDLEPRAATAAGAATVAATGAAIAAGAGTAAGSSTVAGASSAASTVAGAGTSAGVAAAAAVGVAIVAAAGTAAGVASVSGSSGASTIAAGAGTAAGTATAAASGGSVRPAAGTIAATSTAAATAATLAAGAGLAASTAAAAAQAVAIVVSAGTAAGTSTATGAYVSDIQTSEDLDAFFGEFSVPATWSGNNARVLLDAATDDIFGTKALATDFVATMPITTFIGLSRGQQVTIDGSVYSVREIRALDDGSIKQATLRLVSGTGPVAFADDDSIDQFFAIPGFAREAAWGPLPAKVMLDTPTMDVLSDRALGDEYTATLKRSAWPGIKRGDTVTISPGNYRVREVRYGSDGAIKTLTLAKL